MKSACLMQNQGSHFHSSLNTNPLFHETLQNSFTSPVFCMNYCTVLLKLRSQVKDLYEIFMKLVSFFILVMEPTKCALAGNSSFEAKLVKLARGLQSIVVFTFLSEVISAVTRLYRFS